MECNMILTTEEIKVIKDFLAPAVKNGLLDAKRLAELLELASAGMPAGAAGTGKLYTVTEAAELLGCHPKSIYRYLREGRLHKVQLGKRAIRIAQQEIEQLLKS